jgi:serine/threonine protein kinase
VTAAGAMASSAIEGFVTIVEKSAPALPFIGPTLLALTLVYRQVSLARANTAEISALTLRLGRLDGLLREAAKDESFISNHQAIFSGISDTLTNAAHTLEVINARSSFMQFANASSDVLQLKAIDRQLTAHVAEFTAAQTTETLAAVRTLTVRSNINTGNIVLSSNESEPPPPPFSMGIELKDILFDPPLEKQLPTAPRGSYGVVVFGIWRTHNLNVAVKLLTAQSHVGEAVSVMSWLQEAELMRRLREHKTRVGMTDPSAQSHTPRHITLLYGIGAFEEKGQVKNFIVVMERMSGTVRDALDKYRIQGREPALLTALKWVLECATGLAEVHDANVVHSDVKAANVLVDKHRRAKISDLGTGRLTRGLTGTSTMMGTMTQGARSKGSPLWLAPELIEDPTLAPSMASDIYAWAITAWEILSMRLPYHDENNQPVLNFLSLKSQNSIVSGRLRPDLMAVRSDCPVDVLSLIQKAWVSEPRDRPSMEKCVSILSDVVNEVVKEGHGDMMSNSDLPGQIVDTKR